MWEQKIQLIHKFLFLLTFTFNTGSIYILYATAEFD